MRPSEAARVQRRKMIRYFGFFSKKMEIMVFSFFLVDFSAFLGFHDLLFFLLLLLLSCLQVG